MDQERPGRIGIVANTGKEGVERLQDELERGFADLGIEVLFEGASAPRGREAATVSLEAMSERVDLVIVLGGDGTMLQAVRGLGERPVPVAGINTGTLGFLTTATEDGVGRLVEEIGAGRFDLNQRTLVEVALERARGGVERLFGLNEVVVSRGAISRIINLEARVDGRYLNRFHADGLIVSTPTGSTAYSLSAGGPLVSPGARVFVITPICPHALANRSFVVEDRAEIEVIREEEAEEVVLAVDGQRMLPVEVGDVVRVRRAGYTLPLVTLDDHGIYEVLQKKLHWYGSHV